MLSTNDKNPALEIITYKYAAINATLAELDIKAFCWRLAADDAKNYLRQKNFFTFPKNRFSHHLATQCITNQRIYDHSAQLQKTQNRRWRGWMFSHDPFIREAASNDHYWIARSAIETSLHLEQERASVTALLKNNPELLQETLSHFETVQKREVTQQKFSSPARIFHSDPYEEVAKADVIRQREILMPGSMSTCCPDQNSSLTQYPSAFPVSTVDQHEICGLEESILFHRAKTVAFTASYLAALKIDFLKATLQGEEARASFLKKAVYSTTQELSLRKKILAATEQGEDEQACYLILAASFWNSVTDCYQKTVESLASKNIFSHQQAIAENATQAAHCFQRLIEKAITSSSQTERVYLERALFLSNNAFDYRMQSVEEKNVLSPLIRIFHTDSSPGAANPDADKEEDRLRQRPYVSYCPRSNSSLTQYPLDVHKPQQNQYEIDGLIPSWWKKAARATEWASFCWSKAAGCAARFPSWEPLLHFWKAMAYHFEYKAKNKVKRVIHHKRRQTKEPVLERNDQPIEKELPKNDSNTLDKKISFCLPSKALPDAACMKAWSEGKLAPRLEFTIFHSWIFQTWNQLRQAGIDYHLSTQLLEQGTTLTWGFYVMNSLGTEQSLPDDVFLVDVIADRFPHPGAHLYLTQNKAYARLAPHTLFIPHWPQRNLIPRNPDRGASFEHVAFFGDFTNLAPELQSEGWRERLLKELGIHFFIQGNLGWHDYSNIDAVVAIRDFSTSRHFHKPATKLYNAWLAGVPFIGGLDSAYSAEGRPGKDYLVATSLEEVFQYLKRLKEDEALRQMLVGNGRIAGKAFTQEATLERWKKLLQETIPAYRAAWQKKSALERRWFFFINRLICFLNYYLQ